MAGPGRRGPPRWDDDFEPPDPDDGMPHDPGAGVTSIEYVMIQAEAVRLRTRGWTLQRIAEKLGYERSSIGTMLKKIEEQTVSENAPPAARAWELTRIDTILDRMWPRLDPMDPDATPDLRHVAAFIALSKRRSDLIGMDVRPAQTLHIDDPAAMRAAEVADIRTRRLERMMELADKMQQSQIGSGRVIETTGRVKDE